MNLQKVSIGLFAPMCVSGMLMGVPTTALADNHRVHVNVFDAEPRQPSGGATGGGMNDVLLNSNDTSLFQITVRCLGTGALIANANTVLEIQNKQQGQNVSASVRIRTTGGDITNPRDIGFFENEPTEQKYIQPFDLLVNCNQAGQMVTFELTGNTQVIQPTTVSSKSANITVLYIDQRIQN